MMWKMYVLVVVCAFVAMGCASTAELDSLRMQNESLRSQVNRLHSAVSEQDRAVQSLQDTLQRERDAKVALSSQLKAAQKEEIGPLTNEHIQRALTTAGFYKGSIDGKIGPQTQAAIVEFQRAHGLKADGVVGRETSAALRNYLP